MLVSSKAIWRKNVGDVNKHITEVSIYRITSTDIFSLHFGNSTKARRLKSFLKQKEKNPLS